MPLTYLRFPTIIEKMKKLVFTIVVNVLITLSVVAILIYSAQDAHPASGLYNLKRVEEKLILATKTTPDARVDYYIVMLNERQGEIKMVMVSKDYRHLLDTSLRYTSQAGEATNIVVATNDINGTQKLRDQFSKDRELFVEYMKILPQSTPELKHLQDGLNYLKIYEDQLPR